ncbi:TRAP transporter substrate-binding protein DctP [Hydrogenophaga sp.]|uniref:TRAP transporter substrate-binding protein DctP n=1 Tax=Hydrogenophaga sp. TaxID=1904254 RepID=UPI002AC9C9AB|nr:TRAP transporter substrate-binding protein DctP [Hydrogenophaga sp.]
MLLNSFLAPQHPVTNMVIKPWAEKIGQVTEGRVKVDVAPSSLAAPNQQMASVNKGVFDIAYQFHGLMAEQVKLNQIAHLPFVNSTAKGSSVALWRTYQKHFVKANELDSVHVLAMFVLPPGVMYGMKGSIDGVDKLKGRKIYALPGVPAELLEAAGAGVVAAPAARSHEIVSGKTVDAFVGYSVSDANGLKTLSYATDVTDLPGNLTAPSFVLFINKKRWDALSEKDRKAIDSISGEAFAQNMKMYDDLEAKIRADAAAKGIKFHMASESFQKDLRALAAPITQEWLKDAQKAGINGPEALEFYRTQAASNR